MDLRTIMQIEERDKSVELHQRQIWGWLQNHKKEKEHVENIVLP